MSYPTGYNAEPLMPIIIIKNIAGVEQFRWEPDVLDVSPTREFSLTAWSLHGGINTNHGLAEILIDNRDNALTDLTSLLRECKIKNSWELEVKLGKDVSTINTVFVGIIQEPEMIRPSANLGQALISATGWGVRTAHRHSRIQRFQKKLADGLNLDETDTAAKVSELFKDILQDTDHLAHPGIGLESITVTDVDDIDIKLPDYQRDFQSFGSLLNELANIGGAYYGVDASKNAFLRKIGGTDSGFLISNHLETGDAHKLLTDNWNQNKLMILRNDISSYKDTTIGYGFTTIIGVGAQHDTLDQDQTSANAVLDLSANDYDFPFIANKDNVSKVSLFLSKVGTIDDDLHVCIIGADSSLDPNPDDLRQRKIIKANRLEREITTGGNYFEVSFDKDVVRPSVGEKLFVRIEQFPDAVNILRIDYQTGTGNYFLGGVSQVGDAKFRTYHSKSMHIIGQNTVARKTLRDKETVISLGDFPNEETANRAMEAFLDILGKKKRLYNPLIVSTPTNFLELGKTARLMDKFTGLDSVVNIIGYDISGSSFDDANLGAIDMTIYLEALYL